LGDTTVGKTAFFKRFFLNEFTDSFITTIGLTELSKYVKIEYKVYKIQIWDTSGQKR
jgi:GTPase SAR1 family protein